MNSMSRDWSETTPGTPSQDKSHQTKAFAKCAARTAARAQETCEQKPTNLTYLETWKAEPRTRTTRTSKKQGTTEATISDVDMANAPPRDVPHLRPLSWLGSNSIDSDWGRELSEDYRRIGEKFLIVAILLWSILACKS